MADQDDLEARLHRMELAIAAIANGYLRGHFEPDELALLKLIDRDVVGPNESVSEAIRRMAMKLDPSADG